MNEEIRLALMRVLPFAIILIAIIVAIKKGRINPQSIDLRKPVFNRYLLWVSGFLFLVLLIELVFYKLGILETTGWNHPLASSVIRITGAVILAPVTEEIIFRGMILNALTKRNVKLHLAVFIQAAFFVLLHNFAWENTLSSNIGIVQSFMDACLFAYARYHTKSLYTSMTMHITGNLVATLERFIL
jgi:membrane protease YdiL (CAAX protease family)